MIHFNFAVTNPSWDNRFKNLWHAAGESYWKYKQWEVQLMQNDCIVRVELAFTTRCDHAGVQLELGLLGYEIHFGLCDTRHWNYEKKRWTTQQDLIDLGYGRSNDSKRKDQ